MSFFWGNVFEYFKERRYAAVFFGTLMGLIGMLAAGAIIYQVVCEYELERYWGYALLAGLLLSGGWIGRGILRARRRRRDRGGVLPLSRDELTKARSKLLKR
jgi:hypothetical protein